MSPRLKIGAVSARASLCLALGCAPAAAWPAPTEDALNAGRPARPLNDQVSSTARAWATQSRSPALAAMPSQPLPGCQRYEAGLVGAARTVAARQLAGRPELQPAQLVAELRAAGVPYVWPRVWTIEGAGLTSETVQHHFRRWLAQHHTDGEIRCGGVLMGRVAAAVVVDVVADLSALPTRARLGQWMKLRAQVDAVPVAFGDVDEGASAAQVVLLGPRGLPRSALTRRSGRDVESTFTLDQPGLWRVQVVAGRAGDPRPVLESWVFVDETPSLELALRKAPGEQISGVGTDHRRVLLDMLNAARLSEGLPPLRRDPDLDVLAQAHAEAMRAARRTAHDVGGGSPAQRLAQAGLRAARVGENVAHATSLALAHRALWDSPSHRGNVLFGGYQSVGLGVAGLDRGKPVASGDSDLWVCQLFVDHGTVLTQPSHVR